MLFSLQIFNIRKFKQESILTASHGHFTREKVFKPKVCQSNSTIESALCLDLKLAESRNSNKWIDHYKSNKPILVIFHRTMTATMAFCCQNCSDLLWERIVLGIEKNFWNSRLQAENLQKNLRSLYYSSSERSEQFLVTECLLTLFLEVSKI